jgi:ubiquinone/menaquinone biosynthesis C-methylase UbiE
VLQALQAVLQGHTRVLEVGCGTGNYLLALAASIGCASWGIDPPEGMLARARGAGGSPPLQQAMTVGAGILPPQFRPGSAERLDFPDASFDLVYSVDVIHHVTDRARYIHEAYRVLAPGGAFCTATDSEWIIRNRAPLSTHFPETVEVELARYPRIAALRALYEQAGFVEIDERTVEFRYPLTDIQAYRDKAFSALHLISEEAFQRGLARMEADLQGDCCRTPIFCVSRYTLLWGRKGQEARGRKQERVCTKVTPPAGSVGQAAPAKRSDPSHVGHIGGGTRSSIPVPATNAYSALSAAMRSSTACASFCRSCR